MARTVSAVALALMWFCLTGCCGPCRHARSATYAQPAVAPCAPCTPPAPAGQQPFPAGAACLREHGYRTVLHVRAPGTDDAAARRQFEKYGLRYLTLEVSPQTLTKELVDRFNQIVNDEANRPLFVYD